MGRHSRKFELAKQDFEYSHDKGGYKYKYLPQWLQFKSRSFRKHTDGNKEKVFFNLKRGTLVYVQLGVNLGTEFSGNHFCIVLDKKDNKYKETVTVIPLSSKNKPQYVELKDNVVIHAKGLIDTELSKTGKEIEEYKEKTLHMSEETDKYKEIINRLSTIEEVKEEDLNDLKELDTEFREIKKDLEERRLRITKKHAQLKTLIDRYSKLDGKSTYAHINAITTVSKQRLIRINELDPTARVQFSDDSMEQIDKEISRRFLNI